MTLPSEVPNEFQVNWPLEKLKIGGFQDGHHGGYVGFPIRTILAIFIPRHTIMAGYYGFTLVVRESVHPFFVSG